MLKDGLVAWIPAFLADRFALSASSVLILTTAVPIVNLSGAYIARALYRRTGERVERSASILFLAGSAGLALTTAAGGDIAALSGALPEALHPTLLLQCVSIAGLAAATASMMAVNSLLTAIYPLKFKHTGRVSTVSGFLNALGARCRRLDGHSHPMDCAHAPHGAREFGEGRQPRSFSRRSAATPDAPQRRITAPVKRKESAKPALASKSAPNIHGPAPAAT